jgi:hypothetical protein
MPKLHKWEIELLKVVKSCQPSGVAVIHDQCEGTLKATQIDLGSLYNSGYLMIKHKQYSVTGKGELALAAANLTIENGKTLPEREHEAKLEVNDLVIMESRCDVIKNDVISNDVAIALDGLEKKLSIEPVVLTPVEQYELKCQVIDRLSDLLDPSISSVLDDIKQDVTQLHVKAA